jgi:hypothetical protein
VAEDQELVVTEDVAQHFARMDLDWHSFLSWLGRRVSTSLEGRYPCLEVSRADVSAGRAGSESVSCRHLPYKLRACGTYVARTA